MHLGFGGAGAIRGEIVRGLEGEPGETSPTEGGNVMIPERVFVGKRLRGDGVPLSSLIRLAVKINPEDGNIPPYCRAVWEIEERKGDEGEARGYLIRGPLCLSPRLSPFAKPPRDLSIYR